MDIRNFFAAAKKPPASSSTKKPVVEETSSKSSKKAAPEPSKKNKKTEKPKQEEAPTDKVVPKKRKVIVESDDDDDNDKVIEVSPQEFFASSKKPSKPSTSSPSKKAKVKEDEASSSSPPKSDSNGKTQTKPATKVSPRKPKAAPAPRKKEDDEEEEEDRDNVKPKAKRKENPSSSSPVPAARSQAKKSRSSPGKKKGSLSSSSIPPSLELESFDIDNLPVPECLKGQAFVFTGVLENLHRDAAGDLVKSLGGRVTSAVSGKTNYLVVGETLEDGRNYTEGSKYKTTIENFKGRVHIVMGERQLYGLCHLYQERAKKEAGISTPTSAPPPTTSAVASAPKGQASTTPAPAASTTSTTNVPVNPYAKKPVVNNPYAKKPVSNPYAKKSVTNNPYAKKSGTSAPATAATSTKPKSGSNTLWVDRHAPTSTRDILGNKENVSKLQQWLRTWEHTFNNPKAYNKAFSNPRGPWKAALLSGPPGIGKTTTATLVAKESGRDLLEFNASDARSKKALQTKLGDITGSQTLNFGSSNEKAKSQQGNKFRCIIMDEVDGMGSGDRSGMAELIQMIKKSKVPIICICNDRQSQKMKSLLPYCMDLRFKRPVKTVMARRAVRIAQEEGLQVEMNAAEAIAESCGNDVRQVLNVLQMWASKGGSSGDSALTYKGLKEREGAINKDEILRVSLFDAAKTILEGRRNLSSADSRAEISSIMKRSDAFFVDYSLVGLLVQQNYPKVMIGQHGQIKREGDQKAEEDFLKRMHDAAMAMSDYAMVENEVRSGDQNWGLLPCSAMLTVKTGYHAGGPNGGMLPGFPEFTSWMGKNSTKGKKVRLLSELHHHMNFKISGGSMDMRQTYLPVLRSQLLTLLQTDQLQEAIELMDEYGLSREDVMEKLDEFKMSKDDKSFSDLDSKKKAAFTRQYNSGSHMSQALVDEQGAGPKRKAKGSREKDPADLDAIDEDAVDEESDDDVEEDLEKLKAQFKKKGRKKAAPKKKTSKK